MRGGPSTPERQEARNSTVGRRDLATQRRADLIKQIVSAARVYQGGGGELVGPTLEDRIRESATAALVRLFPRLNEADSSGWGEAEKRAKKGADQPFQPKGPVIV